MRGVRLAFSHFISVFPNLAESEEHYLSKFNKSSQILNNYHKMYSRLSRSSTARGSNTGLFCVGPTKVKACKS